MDKAYQMLVITTLLLLSTSQTYAHPGNTASDGCHYCRTNCSSWGVAWNERHCHGRPNNGSTQYLAPTAIRTPLIFSPTNTSIPLPTSTPVPPTLVPTRQKTNAVRKEEREPVARAAINNNNSDESGSGGTITALALAAGGGYWIYKKKNASG